MISDYEVIQTQGADGEPMQEVIMSGLTWDAAVALAMDLYTPGEAYRVVRRHSDGTTEIVYPAE